MMEQPFELHFITVLTLLLLLGVKAEVLEFYGPSYLASTINGHCLNYLRNVRRHDAQTVYNEILDCSSISDSDSTGMYFYEDHHFDGASAEVSQFDPVSPEIPVAHVLMSFPFNLPSHRSMGLDQETLAGIFNSTIEFWNDSRIGALNNGTNYLPSERIILIELVDRSKSNQQTNRIIGCSAEAVLSLVESTPYSIGVVPSAIVKNLKVSVVTEIRPSLRNKTTIHEREAGANMGHIEQTFITDTLSARFSLSEVTESNCEGLISSLICVHWLFLGDSVDPQLLNGVGLAAIPEVQNLSMELLYKKIQQCENTIVDLGELQSLLYKVEKPQSTDLRRIVITVVLSVMVTFFFIGFCIVRQRSSQNSMLSYLEPEAVQYVCGRPPKVPYDAYAGMTYIWNRHHQEVHGTPSSKSKGSIRNLWSVESATYCEDVYLTFSIETNSTLLKWKKKTKSMLADFKTKFDHPNILLFVGATEIGRDTVLLGSIAEKGTLHFFLQTNPFNLEREIRLSFCSNVANGVSYLHSRGVVHGSLSSLTCYVTDTLMVKIGDWQATQIHKSENENRPIKLACTLPDDIWNLLHHLYLEGFSMQTLESVDKFTDSYGLGLLFIEIITGQPPYFSELFQDALNVTEVMQNKCDHGINPDLNIHPTVKSIGLNECIEALTQIDRKSRLSASKAAEQVKKLRKSKKGIVDLVLKSMEAYASDLDACVKERSDDLKATTDRMESLLHEVLPQSIACKLLHGERVDPECFDSVTILFAAIFGFEEMCVRLSPTDVMSFLNETWIMVEEILREFDVHRVDTIGDTVMIASGVPNRNGDKHATEIANLGLRLRENCTSVNGCATTVRFLFGINTGSVTTGVIGAKMPQFCMFGDTVNVASRMETTSEPDRIQISGSTREILGRSDHNFLIKERGLIDLKGKGKVMTHWLIGKRN